MISEKKKRCIGCMLFISAERDVCPHCGYREDSGFSQPYRDALPLCSVVGHLRIGNAVRMEKNSIVYVGLDTRNNRRVLIREFFPAGYVRRLRNGYAEAADPVSETAEAYVRQRFCGRNRRTAAENGTVYTWRAIGKKKVRKKTEMLSEDGIRDGSAAVRSIIGARSDQEDAAALRVFRDGMFAVLCDGMGGISGGETASAECVRVMLEAADPVRVCEESVTARVLRRQAEEADRCVSSLQDMEERRMQCGTTLVCAAVRGNHLYFVSAGDSHLYLIRDGAVQLLTEEHNYLACLLRQAEAGEMTYEEAVSHPKREALTSYIGHASVIQTAEHTLRRGDMILLCSDGLYRALRDEEILQIAEQSPTAEAAADAMIRIVEEMALPKQDNTTLILYKHTGRKRRPV